MLSYVNFVILFWSFCSSMAVNGVEERTEIDNNYPHRCVNDLCWCNLNNTEVDCDGLQGRELRYIPKLPKTTTVLLISHSQFPVINATTFNNISNLKLKELTLSKNGVMQISKDAFQGLPYLAKLYLWVEPSLKLDELKLAFSSLCKESIEFISFNGMTWLKIDEQLFCYLNDSGLSKIDLSMNELEEIDFKIFSGLKNLFHIDLFQNKLTKLKFAVLENLQNLDLRNNGISDIPYLCNRGLIKDYFPKLRYLDLSSNKFKFINPEKLILKCLPNLKTLILTGNPLIIIAENFIFYLRSLVYLDVSKIDAKHTSLNPDVFFGCSLTTLVLNFNVSLFQNFRDNPDLLFRKCGKLTNLSLSHTKLPDNKTKLNALFSHTTRIQKLDLSFTEISVLPEVSFSRMTSLKYLNLTGNKIRTWDGTRMFGNSTFNLSFLSMKDNQISVLNTTSFPTKMLKHLKKGSLDLSENPYLCTCQTLESINLIRAHVDILLNYPDGYWCLSPSDVSGTQLIDYNPSAESCAEKNIPLLVSVPMSLIAVTTMSVIFLVYKCRWRLRYGIYLFNNRYKNYDRLADSYCFEYAGFVIYSDADRSWVHNELIHRLEDEEGFRLCIRLRDFAVGKVHVDNIVDNMSHSEKIIVVLSNNFARDEWCDFQLLLAETRLLKQNTDMLVIFMLEEIHSDCLRASLYKLVTERQFGLWSDGETGKELFWKQAVSQMKKSTAKDYGTMA